MRWSVGEQFRRIKARVARRITIPKRTLPPEFIYNPTLPTVAPEDSFDLPHFSHARIKLLRKRPDLEVPRLQKRIEVYRGAIREIKAELVDIYGVNEKTLKWLWGTTSMHQTETQFTKKMVVSCKDRRGADWLASYSNHRHAMKVIDLITKLNAYTHRLIPDDERLIRLIEQE